MNYIDQDQMKKVYEIAENYKIPMESIKNMLKINYLSDMTIQQYNYLLLIIYQVESKWANYD